MTQLESLDHGALLDAYGRGLYREALAMAARSLKANPHQPQVLNVFGACLQSLGEFDKALDVFNLCLNLKPDCLEALNNKGNVLKELGRSEAALECFRTALAFEPSFAVAAYNLGNTLKERGQDIEALDYFRMALSIDTSLSSAGWNMALILLRRGQYEEGWALYEHGWGAGQRGRRRELTKPLWLGRECLSGKTLLVHWEQGYGDVIQFCRYVPQLWALGIRVMFWVPPGLERLMLSLGGFHSLLTSGDPFPPFDYHCPLMTLPFAFKTTLATIPSHVPYLHAEPARCNDWAIQLQDDEDFRVGLVWSGGRLHPHDGYRSIPLSVFQHLFKTHGVTFHSLQIDVREADLPFLEDAPVLQHETELLDFADTAALIHELDLVISVDTAVAHLAGALGKPVWILLHHLPDYRWMMGCGDSPWYPQSRLFRQTNPGDWFQPLQEVEVALKEWVELKRDDSKCC
jgi:hypothetical protein